MANNREADAKRIASLIGLAKKAGKVTSGIPIICDALRAGKKPILILVSESASDNSIKKISDKSVYYNVELLKIPLSSEELAHSVGKSGSTAAVAINDNGLAGLVRSALIQD